MEKNWWLRIKDHDGRSLLSSDLELAIQETEGVLKMWQSDAFKKLGNRSERVEEMRKNKVAYWQRIYDKLIQLKSQHEKDPNDNH